jgi:hypothetical protein
LCLKEQKKKEKRNWSVQAGDCSTGPRLVSILLGVEYDLQCKSPQQRKIYYEKLSMVVLDLPLTDDVFLGCKERDHDILGNMKKTVCLPAYLGIGGRRILLFLSQNVQVSAHRRQARSIFTKRSRGSASWRLLAPTSVTYHPCNGASQTRGT